jgi:hypothetical protein
MRVTLVVIAVAMLAACSSNEPSRAAESPRLSEPAASIIDSPVQFASDAGVALAAAPADVGVTAPDGPTDTGVGAIEEPLDVGAAASDRWDSGSNQVRSTMILSQIGAISPHPDASILLAVGDTGISMEEAFSRGAVGIGDLSRGTGIGSSDNAGLRVRASDAGE